MDTDYLVVVTEMGTYDGQYLKDLYIKADYTKSEEVLFYHKNKEGRYEGVYLLTVTMSDSPYFTGRLRSIC